MRIGVDMLSIARFSRIATHHRYRALVFTGAELARVEHLGDQRRVEKLAGWFCLKEATCKAIGRGFNQGMRWRDIEVRNDQWGAPSVTLHGGARRLADEAGVRDIVVTLTHQLDTVVAVAAATVTPTSQGKDTS